VSVVTRHRALPVVLPNLVPHLFGRQCRQSLMGVIAGRYPLATVIGDRVGPAPVVPERGQLGFSGSFTDLPKGWTRPSTGLRQASGPEQRHRPVRSAGQAERRTLVQTWRGPETRAGGDPRPATITIASGCNDVLCCVSESPLIITAMRRGFRGQPMGVTASSRCRP
jgi:hypothetical protein